MNSNLSIFQFESKEVRVVLINGEPWFVAKDVSEVLEYAKTDKMLNLVDDDDKQIINPQKMGNSKMEESFNSNTFKVSVINESGLYACIFGSTKPEAKRFKKWITSDVLPSIRKTGGYSIKTEAIELPKTYLEALKALVASEEAKLKLEAKIEKDAPLVAFAEAIKFSEDSVDVGTYAKMIGTGRNRLFAQMRECGIIMKNSTLPYQCYVNAGYFEVSQEIDSSNGKLIPFCLITGKGQLWLKQKLEEYKMTEQRMLKAIGQQSFLFG